jgi:hypothetical protein
MTDDTIYMYMFYILNLMLDSYFINHIESYWSVIKSIGNTNLVLLFLF